MRKPTHLALALLAGGSSLAIASMASAQTAPAPAGNEIVVTGSRVIQNGNNSPIPVTVVSEQLMAEVQPTTLSDQINELPQLQGSQTQTTSGTGIRNGSAAYLILRNAGDNHTLVLYDGQRMAPTTSEESHASDVDINMIPQMLIQRVDVVTGGVSAVYGSDAVTGVVNFITDTKFNGLKLQLSDGVSNYGDDRIFDGGIAAGTKLFGDRGHFEFSFEHHDDPGIMNHLARPVYASPPGYSGNGTTVPFNLTSNVRTSNQSFNGLITNGTLSGLVFDQNNVANPFVNGTATGVANQQVGGDGAWGNITSLKSSLTYNQLFGRFDYDITDNIHGFVQFAGTQAQSINIGSQTAMSVNIGFDNAFLQGIGLPAGFTNPYNAANTTSSFGLTRTLDILPQQIVSHTNYTMVLGGLSGSISNYKWEVGGEHIESDVQIRDNGNINLGNFYAAVNAVVNPANGQTVCHAALTNAAYSNCVPLNLFGPTSASPAALAYVTAVTGSNAQTLFDDVHGSFSGSPFSTWAGPVNMAVSGEWRNLGYHLLSFSTPADLANCSGIQFSCTQGTTGQWQYNTLLDRSPDHQTVGEIAYEADVPLAKDLPFMQALNLNGAVRYTDYNTSGSVVPWKVGLEWHVNDEVTLRATRSRDIRAPNLNELFNPAQPNISQRSDLHTNTSAVTQAVSLPNPNLVPEQADTTTAGLVWRPHFIPRFSLSVDAYHITINDAIIVVSGTSTQVQQACEASGGTSPYCALFVRPLPFSNTTAANFPTQMLGLPLNIADIDTYGVDFEANYSATVLDRPLTLRGLMSWQPHLVYNVPGIGISDIADTAGGTIAYGTATASPSIKVTGIIDYKITPDLNVTVLERWRNAMATNANYSLIYATGGTVPAIAYTNLNLAYTMHNSIGSTELYLNIQNLFNTYQLPYAVQGGDDPFGRYFTVGLRFKH